MQLSQCYLHQQARIISPSMSSMALEKYKDILISETQSSLLTNEMRGAIRKELGPITSRLSRGLYRYGVLIDMLCQMLSYMQFGGGDEIMNHFYKRANARMGRARGKIDLQGILDDTWEASVSKIYHRSLE